MVDSSRLQFRAVSCVMAGLFMLSANLMANVNVLVIGSSRDSGERHNSGVWWNAAKPAYTPNSKAFSSTAIGTQLQSILNQDNRGTVNVTVLDRYRSDPAANGWTAYSYNLMTWIHYPYPAGSEVDRWANLRGESGTQWDYVVLVGDPYTMEYTPGVYSLGVARVAEEVAKGGAQLILLMPWPGSGSSSSVNHYKQVVYRTARAGGYKVAPAALAWQACGSPTTSGSHPNAAGAYIAASSIYSCMYNQSAAASAYVSSDANANTTYTTYVNNNTASQYTGTFSFQNPYLILDDKTRQVHMSETGTSTEDGFKSKIKSAISRSKVSVVDGSYNDKYDTETPEDDAMGWPTGNPMPIGFNYGRDGFYSESNKKYMINPTYWKLGFGYYYQHNSWSQPVETASDEHIALMQQQDNDLANRMINEAPNARNIPVRSLFAQISKLYPTMNPLRDGSGPHLNYNLDEAVGSYIYTIYSGRCPMDAKPAADDIIWECRRIGYETAWMAGRCQSRAPGFKVTPSLATKTTITPGSKETMTVEFILPPQQDVTVNVSISNSNAAIVGSKQLVFTPQNYTTPQTVSVTGLAGSAASDTFNVVFSTTSTDEVCNGLSDTWEYTTTRNAPVTLTRVNKATSQVNGYQNLPVTINLNTTGATSANTVLAGPSRGSLAWSGSNVVYTPDSDFLGKDGFSFATNDGSTLSVGYVEITVSAAVANGMVSYRGNGSDGGTVPIDSATYAQSASVTVLGNSGNLTKAGYSFAGWNTAANGSGTTYGAGATFAMGATGKILYAKWTTVPTYTVTYNGNSNTSGAEPYDQTKTSGVDLTLETNIGDLVRTGYNFVGWNTAADGSGMSYAAGAVYSSNSDITLYAEWELLTYTVNYNANSATSGSIPSNQTKTYGVTLQLQTNSGNLARVGYVFSGWNAKADGTGNNYAEGGNYTGNKGLTLYAKWTASTTYTVTFNANGGTAPSPTTLTVTDGSAYGTLATTSRAGYAFNGWFTAASGGSLVSSTTTVTATADHTLYAQWTAAATYVVSYNGNGKTGGTVPSNQTKTQGVALTLATNSGNLTKTGYSFAGWNTAANGSGTPYAVGDSYTADSAVTLYAKWNTAPSVNAGQNQTVYLANGASWLPSSLSPQAWYDASDASTITASNGLVSEWRDKSTNSRHASQITEANQPAIGSSSMGGRNVITLNGSSQYFNLNLDYLAGVSHSAFIVTKATTYTDIYGAATSNSAANSLHVGFNGASNFRMNYWGNDYGPAVGAAFNASGGNVLNYVWTQGTSKQILANGTSQGSNTNAGTIGTMAGGGRLGQVVNHAYYGGDLAEIIFITGTVSQADREKMEGYLAHKWGLENQLPTGHPYEGGAPGAAGVSVNLNGTVTDIEQTPTGSWSVISKPIGSTVTFGDAGSIDTTAVFTQAGEYVLRLTGDDGYVQATDDVTILINPALPSKYANWASGGFSGTFTDIDPSINGDGDGKGNMMEFAFGTDPTLADGGSLAINGTTNGDPIAKKGVGDVMQFYFVRRKDHGTSGSVSYTVQFSSDLGSFSNSVNQPNFEANSSVNTDYEIVKVPFPTASRFARIQVNFVP